MRVPAKVVSPIRSLQKLCVGSVILALGGLGCSKSAVSGAGSAPVESGARGTTAPQTHASQSAPAARANASALQPAEGVERRRAEGSTLPVAVVELFTSEGCSSCPPADRVLADIEAERISKQENVISLAFHVDYWDRLGWTDRFSDRAYSDRQRWYALRQPEPRVYTPQMIVQGHEQFIGSHRDEARQAIKRALAAPATASVTLALEQSASHELKVDYVIERAKESDHLSFALVQRQASTDVQSGENSGHTLKHTSIVVDYAQRSVGSGRGSWQPNQRHEAASAVVAVIQESKTLRVLGAQRLELGH